MNISILDETRTKVANDFHNWSFENHMSLYASHNVQEAVYRAGLLEHLQDGEAASQRNRSSLFPFAPLVVIVAS